MSDLRYPIGQFTRTAHLTGERRTQLIAEIEATPSAFRKAVEGCTVDQLNTLYRPGGWTVRQVSHHLVDSHLNAFVRFKLALTEEYPTIKPYQESKWAETVEAKTGPIRGSLSLLEALHERWVHLLRSMDTADFQRTLNHPEFEEALTLDDMLQLYAWHGRHHTAHVTSLRKRMEWI